MIRANITNYLRGMASVLEIWPAEYRPPVRSDGEAIKGYWENVGSCIRQSIAQFGGRVNAGTADGLFGSNPTPDVLSDENHSAHKQRYSGPLPSPRDFQQYNMIVPGAAERILRMAEKEQAHCQTIVGETTHRVFRERERGQWFGLIVALLGLSVAAFALWLGYEAAASILGGTTLLGMVAVFVTGQRRKARAAGD